MRSRARRHLFAALIVTCFVREATAQPADVEAEHARGMQLRARGRDAEAAVVFQTLFERTGEPRALARLGLAEGALLRWSDADEHLQGALARQTDPWIAANRANLEAVLASVQQHLGRVMVTCTTPGATVQWTGQAPLTLPLPRPLRVPIGFVDMVIYAPGHAPATRHVAVTAGADPVLVDVALTRDVATATTAPSEHAPPTPTPALTPVVVRTTPTRTWQRPLAIGLLAGAGASLGLGVAGVVMRQGAAGRFNGAGCRLFPDRDEVSVGGSACASELSTTQTGETLSIVGFVAAGVFAAAGVTALLLVPRASREGVRVTLEPTITGRGLNAGVTLGF